MSTLKVFISLPMNGLSNDEIKEKIEDAKKHIIAKYEDQYDIEFLDTSINEECNTKHPLIWYLGKSLEILSNADLAYFVKGWNSARGCRIENQAAYSYDIKTIEEF